MQKLFHAALLVLYHTGYAREYSYLLQHAFVTIFAQFFLSTDPVWKSLECDAVRNKNLSFCYLQRTVHCAPAHYLIIRAHVVEGVL